MSDAALRQAQSRRDATAPIDQGDDGEPEDVDQLGNEDQFDTEGEGEGSAPGYSEEDILEAARQINERRGLGNQTSKRAQRDLEESLFMGQSAGATAAPPVVPKAGLILVGITIEDTDRLWDWIREDAGNAGPFFGKRLRHSQQLHDVMRGLVISEREGTGLARSIHYRSNSADQTEHLGLLALVPILSTEQIALLHIYLRPDMRASLDRIVPWAVEEAGEILPAHHLGVWAQNDAQRKLYKGLLSPLKFAEHTLFVR